MARKVPGVTKTQLQSGERWYATAYDPKPEKGEPRKVRVKDPRTGATTFATQAEAIAAKEHFELIKTKETVASKDWTADAWVTEWTTNPSYARKNPSTTAHYRERVKKFGVDFKGRNLRAINNKEARDWATENAGRAREVRTMLNDALRDGVITENPFSNLRLTQSVGRKKIKPLTEAEVHKLADCADDLFSDWPVLSSMIIVSAYTGMRFGEAAGLKWRDIDWEKGEVHVERQLRRNGITSLPKNGEERTIVLLDEAASALRRLEKQDHDFVFYSRREHKPYAYHVHTYFWSTARAAFYASLPRERQEVIGPDLDFHELRHFCGSWMADNGDSAMDIALQLGHTDGGRLAQELYIHSYEDNARERIRENARKRSRAKATG